MMRIKKIIWLALAVVCTACSDFLEEYSQDLAKVESWTDLDELLLGDGYLKSGRMVVFPSYFESELSDNFEALHFMTDELEEVMDYDREDYTFFKETLFAFYTWQQDTGMDEEFKYIGGDERYWNDLYERINISNMVIALVDEQPEGDVNDRLGKERVKGEAYFLRAAYYFLLVNLYAQPYTPATASSTPGVPVKLSELIDDRIYYRNTVAEVYEQILKDLTEAERWLEGKERKSVYRANLTAAYLLHSRVYLYMQDWKNAADYAQKVLNEQSALLSLASVEEGANSLSKSSPETIFSMGGYSVAYLFADNDGYWHSPSAYKVSDDMLRLFGENDWRSEKYIGEAQYGSPDVFLKVSGQRDRFGIYDEVSDCFLLRTPEAYLTLAEALAMNNQEDVARQTLERFLLTRMKTPVDIAYTGQDLIQFIREERAREFLLEGHRWFDLRRYTVCEKYPYTKKIEHGYAYYDSANYDISHIHYYTLEENDPAYTLPIPRKIRSFQPEIGNNERPARSYREVKNPNVDDDYDDDYDY